MRCKSRKRSIQKRSFFLFEVLVAMGLLLACLFPLIKTHVNLAREEVKRIERLRAEQEVENRFCAIKEQLFEQPHSWKELMHGVKGNGYTIKKVEHSSKQKSPEKALIADLFFTVGKNNYTRRVYIEKVRRHAD